MRLGGNDYRWHVRRVGHREDRRRRKATTVSTDLGRRGGRSRCDDDVLVEVKGVIKNINIKSIKVEVV